MRLMERISRFMGGKKGKVMTATALVGFLLAAIMHVFVDENQHPYLLFLYGYYPLMFFVIAYGFRNRFRDTGWVATVVCSPVFVSMILTVVFQESAAVSDFIAEFALYYGIVISVLIFEHKLFGSGKED